MSTVAAIFLAAMFAVAAITKLRDRQGSREGFLDLGLPMPDTLAWSVPISELGVGVLLIIAPGWGGVAAFALLLTFTVVLVTTIGSGRLVPCRCFGGTSDEPVTWAQVVRNLWLLGLAALASLSGTLRPPTLNQLVATLVIIGVGPIVVWATDRGLKVES